MAIELTERKTAYQGWAKLSVATLRMEDGTILRREVEDHGRAACVLAYDPIRRCAILVRQFRAPPFVAAREPELLEAIAGIIEDEDASQTAIREAREEAGLRLGRLEHIAAAWTMPGLSTERMELFLASYGAEDRIGPGGGTPDEDETIVVAEIGLDDLAAWADDGRLNDLKTLALVQTLRLRRPDLFDASAAR